MVFQGIVKPKHWNRILKPMDDMSRMVVSRAIGVGVFDYKFTWRTNSDIIGSFIGCMVRARVEHGAIIRLCCDIFDPTWRKGLEQEVRSINDKQQISLPKKYMDLPPRSPNLEVSYHFPLLIICENLAFYREWPKMEASIHFLLHCGGIVEEENRFWLTNYLSVFNGYVHPGVVFDNLDALIFHTPNSEKTSRVKIGFEFPPNFHVENPNDISEVIMVFPR